MDSIDVPESTITTTKSKRTRRCSRSRSRRGSSRHSTRTCSKARLRSRKTTDTRTRTCSRQTAYRRKRGNSQRLSVAHSRRNFKERKSILKRKSAYSPGSKSRKRKQVRSNDSIRFRVQDVDETHMRARAIHAAWPLVPFEHGIDVIHSVQMREAERLVCLFYFDHDKWQTWVKQWRPTKEFHTQEHIDAFEWFKQLFITELNTNKNLYKTLFSTSTLFKHT